jgi:hypothetical protein
MFDAGAAARPGLAHAHRIAMIAIKDSLIIGRSSRLDAPDGEAEESFMPRIMSSPVRSSQRH